MILMAKNYAINNGLKKYYNEPRPSVIQKILDYSRDYFEDVVHLPYSKSIKS